MKSIWCDTLNGSWPPWSKLRSLKVTRIYVDAREQWRDDPPGGTLRGLIDGIHSQGFEAGIFRDPVWGGWHTPEEYAQLASRDIYNAEFDPATKKVTPKQIAYMHDLETHDVQWILAALRAWRRPRPLRTTDVTWEPMQGGSWNMGATAGHATGGSAEIDELLRLLAPGGPGGVYHQNYGGGMQPFNAERVRADLVVRGFPDTRLFGFYDGLDLPAAWDGCVFTTGRLR